ncbi:hypothetical protein [Abyssicoccus albus]|uniref:Uncharacterized protein n=1 Tax=Abyssicoccus albus TaxID=1817405 RepID=A0A3N5BCL6_9BACL|nr:hypothetical protein [Abyssicoccus albus]RPF54749.1 hypothetical protein EDD62_1709 [Abyssicoccus albus]
MTRELNGVIVPKLTYDNIIEISEQLYERRRIDGEEVPVDNRINDVDQLIRWYYDEVEYYDIQPRALAILTSYILYENNKRRKDTEVISREYSYLTDRKLIERATREASLEFASNVDSNGIDVSPPTRTLRIEKEEALNVRKWRVKDSQKGYAKGV